MTDNTAKPDRYARISKRYQEGVTRDFTDERLERQIIAPLDGMLRSARAVMDLGCGEGSILKYVAARYPDIKELIGVDRAPTMVSLSEGKQEDARVRIVEGDMARIPFDEGRFNLTYARFAVHHAPKLEPVFAEVARVTAQGGWFYIHDSHPFDGIYRTPSKAYGSGEMGAFPAWFDRGIVIEHPTHTIEEYISAAVSTGWRVVSLRERCGRNAGGREYGGVTVPTSLMLLLQREGQIEVTTVPD